MASTPRSSGPLPARLTLLVVLAAACLQCSAAVAAGSDQASSLPRRALRAAPAQSNVTANSREWADKLNSTYLSNAELGWWMLEYVQRCAPLARRFAIGSSAVDRQPLWVLEISDNPGLQEAEPNFKYVANMHGDETSGRALLPLLAEWLCENYQTDERATRMVRDMHLFIMPTMNPDGFTRSQRYNAQRIDLNRNFSDPQFDCQPNLENCTAASLMRKYNSSAPEVQAIMRWSMPLNARRLLRRRSATSSAVSVPQPPRNVRQFHFTAAANLHEGAVVANYPFDGSPITGRGAAAAAAAASQGDMEAAAAAIVAARQQQPIGVAAAVEQLRVARGSSSAPRTTVRPARPDVASDTSSSSVSSSSARPAGYHASPDDATFRFLASTYATKHTWMSNTTRNWEFPDGGITNGAGWYDVYGGMQDWDYLAGSCMELTLELNENKYPPASELLTIWGENKEALIALPLTAALGGIRGNVTSGSDGLPIPATITVDGSTWRTFADSYLGFFARPVKPGTYTVKAQYPGFKTASVTVTVPEDLTGAVANLVMSPVK
uniref:Peptidase M14 domain-containing protein n=1 Tax=Tetradesmus obliquus TaxID=3088 RepID=A0A383VL25_TETOB|eukprot:jgi/Sobl393_1/4243/SZX65633.1